MRYAMHEWVIVSFRHKGLEALYRSGSKKGVQPAHAAKLIRISVCLMSRSRLQTSRDLDLATTN